MAGLPEPVERAIEEFRRLPTIGRKTAERIVLSLVNKEPEEVLRLSQSILDLQEKVHRCRLCGNICEGEICEICADPRRDPTTLCVVEDVTNLLAFEKSGTYQGRYYVLNGLLSPMQDRGPDQIGVQGLLDRIENSRHDPGQAIQEVIMAISATVEGETTTLFLAELLKDYDVKITRIASGIPVGGSLEYYDELTLSRALEDRRRLN